MSITPQRTLERGHPGNRVYLRLVRAGLRQERA